MEMRRIDSYSGYDFYVGNATIKGGFIVKVYNILPEGSIEPKSGYNNMQYIERIKGVKFPDRYQPTLHG